MADQSDIDLIDAANKGEREAFETLYYRYRDWVFSLAYRFCNNEHDACDVLQETYFFFFNKFPGFELRAQLKTFLPFTSFHCQRTLLLLTLSCRP